MEPNELPIEVLTVALLAAIRKHFYYRGDLTKPIRPYPTGYGEISGALQAVNDAWKAQLEIEHEWSKRDD